MLNKALFQFLWALLLAAGGCSTIPLAHPELDAASKTLKPKPGTALVYIYRGPDTVPGKFGMYICDANKYPSGGLFEGTYVYFYASPGDLGIYSGFDDKNYGVYYSNNCENSNPLKEPITLTEGNTYYLYPEWVDPTHHRLALASEVAGKEAISTMKLAVSGKIFPATAGEIKPKREWEACQAKNSIEGYQEYLSKNPNTEYSNLAKNALQRLLTEREDFRRASAVNSLSTYRDFITKYNASLYRAKVLAAMAAIIYKSKEPLAAFQQFRLEYPDGAAYIPEEYNLYFVGPSGLTIADIIKSKKNGISDQVLSTKIISSEGAYKDFSLEEIRILQKNGLSDIIVEAMIKSTNNYREKAEQQRIARIMEAERERDRLKEEKIAAEAQKREEAAQAQQDRQMLLQGVLGAVQILQSGGKSPISPGQGSSYGAATGANSSAGSASACQQCESSCSSLKAECSKGGQSACYRYGSCVCRCNLNAGGCGNSTTFLQQCIRDNDANAQSLKSGAPNVR